MMGVTSRCFASPDNLIKNIFLDIFYMGTSWASVQCPVAVLIDDRLYSAILRSLKQTHSDSMWLYMSD